jgi:polyisoprenoid-binding protein YceI
MKSLIIINTWLLLLALTPDTKTNAPDENDNTSAVREDAMRWHANASKSQITFTVKGIFGAVHGKLSGLKSSIIFDENNLRTSSITASVDPKTIKTGIKLRDKDLQKEKFLNSDNFPIIRFRSEKIQKKGNGYVAVGDLTIKGTTRRIEIPFIFSEKGNSGVFKSNFDIQRQDFKVGKKGGSVGNTIRINLEVPVTK